MNISAILVILGLVSAVAIAGPPPTQPVGDYSAVGQDLIAVAREDKSSDDQLRNAVTTARDSLPAESIARSKLDRLLSDKLDRAAALELGRDIAFTPTMEAPTARGWPAFTPVGEVKLQRYPKYRMAYVNKGDIPPGGEFFTLFLHIKRNGIEMTAPVEMKMAGPGLDGMTQMAFLYENADLGKLGQDEKVTVVDIDPTEAVSVGGRGNWTEESMRQAKELIEAWLASHPDHEPAGELRVMGYNSPMTPREKAYYEVQQPVKAK
ncbi:hypothetical protein BH09PLA1_BH09PLA1_02490 [soil metagenome]